MRDRWKHVKDIFSAAVATPPHKRRRLLVEQCNGDDALLKEVEELLSAYEGAGDFLEQEVASVHDLQVDEIPEDPQPGDDFSGKKLGVYRLERPIGEGGMGTVYVARRDDDLFEKRVAVKIIRRYHDDRRLERFRKEREILARLNHPNIAQLLDGGVTDDGLPYLVMELVDGVPIDQYCLDNDLDLRSRLSLFTKVFQAVQYAHQSLVVHRDLKPSNILVTNEGEPKLLDFGIAKLLEDEGAETRPATTVTVARWMTPEYASPEQVRGEPITTASDVYSLGVILYKLLTGQSPYDLASQPIYEIERIISEEEPSRPSTVATDNTSEGSTTFRRRGTRTIRLRRGLKGDLDNIILMALRKEADRRYASVEQFNEDIDRYLNGLPVRAQSDTLGYRARKFVQRHRFGVLTVIVFVVFAFSAFGFIIRESNEARQQRDTANELLKFAINMFESSADPELAQDTSVTARELLDHGREEAKTQLRDRPEQLARVLNLLGELYQKLGVYSSAEDAFREALGMISEDDRGITLADGYFGLGRSMYSQGLFDQAESLFEDALSLRAENSSYESAEVAEVIHELANIASEREDLTTADSLIDEAIRIQSKLLGPESEETAISLRTKATVLRKRGDLDAAARLYQDALAIQRERVGIDHPQVAFTLNSLGVVYTSLGDYDRAEELLLRALAIRKERYGQRHPTVAATLYNLNLVMQNNGRYSDAIVLLDEALSIESEYYGPDHIELARTKHSLAIALLNLGRYERAEVYLRDAIRIFEAGYSRLHPEVGIAKHDYAILLRLMDRPKESLEYYHAATEIYRQDLPRYSYELSSALNGQGKILHELGHYEEAVQAFKECLEIRQEILDVDNWRLGSAHSYLGEAMAEIGDPRAQTHLEMGLSIIKGDLGPAHDKTLAAERRLNRYLRSRKLQAAN